MFSGKCATKHSRHTSRHHATRASGNSAFDAYKADTLSRLEDEQTNFEEFLKRLRDAKDKSEFDQFMEDRATRTSSGETDTGETGTGETDTGETGSDDVKPA